jgi:hypothetical protein
VGAKPWDQTGTISHRVVRMFQKKRAAYPAMPPNKPMQPTPLRADKIAAILASRCTQTPFRSIGAARLMGKALARSKQSISVDNKVPKN